MPLQSLWVLLGVFLYNLMALSAKVCTTYFGVFEIIFYRALFGMVCVGALMLYKGIPFHTKFPFAHLKRCLAGTLCFIFEILALENLPLGIAQAIDYSSPLIFTSFLITAAILTRTKIEIPVVIAITIGFVGVLFIIKPSTAGLTYTGVVFGLLGAFLASCTSWFIRDLGKHNESNLRTVFYFMLSGVVIGGGKMILSPSTIHLPTIQYFWPLIGLISSGLLAQIVWTYAWSRGHPLLNSVFQFVGIFYGTILGVLFFSESFDQLTILGMMIIFASGAFSSVYLQKKK